MLRITEGQYALGALTVFAIWLFVGLPWLYSPPGNWALSDKIAAIASAVAFLQFLALIATIWVMIENGRRQLRAYVLTSSAKMVHGIKDDGIPEVHVVIKNSGQTPAHDMMSVGGIAFEAYPPPPRPYFTVSDQDFLSFGKTQMPLGPGDDTLAIFGAKRPFNPAERASLIAGTGACWVHGEIRYRDIFGRNQWTKYRMMLGGPVGIRGGNLVGCEGGNEAS
jgi:hypothetical protein